MADPRQRVSRYARRGTPDTGDRRIRLDGGDRAPGAPVRTTAVPAVVIAGGPSTAYRFLEFFAARIRNPNTRDAYYRNVCSFFRWCARRGLHGGDGLGRIRAHHVAAYVEELGRTHAPPSVKQHLAAVRALFDWLVVGQVVETNPAAPGRGPRHVVKRGRTPVLLGDEVRTLLDTIRTDTLVGLRDRALIGVLVYGFARIGAALAMDVGDLYVQGRRRWLRLHEKGGRRHDMPAHHELEAYLDAYLEAAGIEDDEATPLFRSARGRIGRLSARRLHRLDALRMIKRRAHAAGIATAVGCHTFRASGITVYLGNGGTLEKAQMMAAHESPRTTKLYDRTADRVSLAEVERIALR